MEGHTSALVLALIGMVGIWLAISTGTVLGRIAFERRERVARERSAPRGKLARSRMLRHASSHRTERRKWQRISALRTLVHAGEPRARLLLRRALADDDQDVVGAAVRLLGELGDDWAVGELIETLQNGSYARSRVATQLDALLPKVGRKLVRLLRDDEPAVRFWAATLLGHCPGMASARLVALTRDPDANVRAAAVEAIGAQGNWKALAAAQARLEDDVWFVRVHACRSVGRLGGLAAAPAIAPALRDPWWWVRAAAKDALRALGPSVAGVLIPYLDDEDDFARNGAAEVLQDVGFVDALSRHGVEGELLERIFLAGGAGLREAALRRAIDRPLADEQTVGGVAS